MDTQRNEQSQTTTESRRGFLKKSGKVAAGAAVLPVVMTLSADKARATGSGVRYRDYSDGDGDLFRFFKCLGFWH